MGDVEVVVPTGFNTSLIPAFLDSHKDWLEKMLARTRAQRPAMLDEPVPSIIRLNSVHREYSLYYRQAARSRVRESHGDLEVFLAPDAVLSRLLQRWLSRTARQHLAGLAMEVADETGLRFGRLSIRGQRSRWGSCSATADINLNRSLMFLEPDMVRYVILHELCHTQHLNHSKDFWQLVASHQPDYKSIDGKLRYGWRHVPRWAVAREA